MLVCQVATFSPLCASFSLTDCMNIDKQVCVEWANLCFDGKNGNMTYAQGVVSLKTQLMSGDVPVLGQMRYGKFQLIAYFSGCIPWIHTLILLKLFINISPHGTLVLPLSSYAPIVHLRH
jgi:hypothetical protein